MQHPGAMIIKSTEPLAGALSQRPAAKNKHVSYIPDRDDLGKSGPCTLYPALLECHRGFVETAPGSLWGGEVGVCGGTGAGTRKGTETVPGKCTIVGTLHTHTRARAHTHSLSLCLCLSVSLSLSLSHTTQRR